MARPPKKAKAKKKTPAKKPGAARKPGAAKKSGAAKPKKRTRPPAPAPKVEAKPDSSRFLIVKVVLHDRGDKVETALCQPAGFADGRALFRLDSIPFLHKKPTYDDIVAARGDDAYAGNWTWDRGAGTLHRDGGRYPLRVDYHISDGPDFQRLSQLLRRDHDIVLELGYPPAGKKAGRFYLAAPSGTKPSAVVEVLGRLGQGLRIEAVRAL